MGVLALLSFMASRRVKIVHDSWGFSYDGITVLFWRPWPGGEKEVEKGEGNSGEVCGC
jgi:hypothetical protein